MLSFNVSIFDSLLVVLLVVLVDWAMGILNAFRTNTFSLPYLYHQLEAQALPFGGLLLIGLLQATNVSGQAVATGALAGVFYGAAATYLVKLGDDILTKLGVLMSGSGAPAPAPAPPTPPAA
jgi:hypothetical protein